MALGNLAARFVVAAIGIPALTFIVFLDHHIYTWAVVFIASLIGMNEFFAMTLPNKRDRIASLVLGAIAVAWMYWAPIYVELAFAVREGSQAGGRLGAGELLIPLIGVPAALWYLFAPDPIETAGKRFTSTIAGIIYAGILFTFLGLLKRDFPDIGGEMIFVVLGVTWGGDTGAYFAGRFLGKTKLYPKVSPGKTWAGAIGGLAGSTAVGIGCKVFLLKDTVPWWAIIVISVGGAILGQMGDLCESLLKRSAGVKDSGNLLPGHGGLLDRVDASLFVAPLTYTCLVISRAQPMW